jgi:heptosyltransferase-2
VGRHDSLGAQFGFVRELRRRRFERIVIFSGRARYGALALAAGIRQRVGFGFSWAERLFLNAPPYIRPHAGPGNWVFRRPPR